MTWRTQLAGSNPGSIRTISFPLFDQTSWQAIAFANKDIMWNTILSSTTSLVVTATNILALTTPFIQPSRCGAISSTTSVITSFFWGNYTETTLQIVISDTADPRFSTCQPTGWTDVVPESRFSFSPAVCPNDWTAYQLEATGAEFKSSISTAYCCTRYTITVFRLQMDPTD